MVQSVAMDDRNIARMLCILNKHAKNVNTIEDKRLLAQRAQHFIDRFVDLLEKKRDVEYMQLYFANKFTKELQLQLPVPIETRLFSQFSAVLVENKLTSMSPG